VIRALLDVIEFTGDYAALGRKLNPSISPKQARESIKLLEKLQLIIKNDKGVYKPTEKSVTSGQVIQNELIKEYQFKSLDLAKTIILKNASKPQNIYNNVISVSSDGYKKIESHLQKFKSEIRSIVHKDNKSAEFVCQLNIQLFQNTK
jgi:uncharacterized protein (TIGR02147 family)